MNRIGTWAGRLGLIGIASTLIFSASTAHATVKLEGTWPESDKTISIDASGLARSEAVRKIADAAGWSIVVHAPAGDPIDLHVKNQPAAKVLDLVLDDASYVAKRDGSLISITRQTETTSAATAAPPVEPAPIATQAQTGAASVALPPAPPPAPLALSATPPVPPAPPTAVVTRRGEDRLVTGGTLRIEKDDVVKDVTVLGGSVDVFGDVTGDLTVLGGSARVHKDGHVERDATAIGGSLEIDDGATVDGDVGVVGGVLTRAPGAKIHGDIVQGKKVKHDVQIKLDDPDSDESPGFSVHRSIRKIGSALTSSAIQFVFGAMLLALATDRMERLRAEIAGRPMRSFAVGVIGAVATILTLVVLCVTLIGIPIAVVGALVGAFGLWFGFAAVLATTGQALFGHRTKNPYVHLALGCLLLLVLGAIPFVGTWLRVFVAFAGFGAVIATRGAGIFAGRARATI